MYFFYFRGVKGGVGSVEGERKRTGGVGGGEEKEKRIHTPKTNKKRFDYVMFP